MPNVVVRCPTCGTRLEVDAEYRGREVRCGACAELFVAEPDRRPADDENPSRRPYHRRRDEDDFDRPRRKRRSDGSSALAVAGLVCGGLSLGMGFCPCVVMVGLPLAGVGLLFAGLAARNPDSRTAAVVGLAVNGVAVAVWVFWLAVWAQLGNGPNNGGWNNNPAWPNPQPAPPAGPGWRP
jgi:predicted Zn finger-like uncharacterized protein